MKNFTEEEKKKIFHYGKRGLSAILAFVLIYEAVIHLPMGNLLATGERAAVAEESSEAAINGESAEHALAEETRELTIPAPVESALAIAGHCG